MYENYAKIRDAKGFKDADVRRATGISSSVFSDWKKGRYNLKYDKLQKIAEFLGVSTDQLTGVQQDVQADGYYINETTARTAQQIFEDPYLQILFDAAQDSRPEDLQMAADLLRRLKKTNPDG